MKLRKLLAILVSLSMIATLLVGCGGSSDDKEDKGANKDVSSEDTDDKEDLYAEPMVFEVYSQAANYQGIQPGWFGKVLKDKFNIELNIIAPQVAGEGLFQTRAATGNLGDIVLLDASVFADAVETGLVRDFTDDFENLPNLMAFQEQIETFNGGLPNNDQGLIYGIPSEMTNSSPTSYSHDNIYTNPWVRWDLYKELGMPSVANLDELLDVLQQMMENHPTNPEGEPAYAFSLWDDWDGGDGMMGIANVVQLTTWYGEKIHGSAILQKDGESFVPLTNKEATYYKMLKFLNDAYQRGMVDPDSGTQDWNTVMSKITAGRTYFLWYNFSTAFWNSNDRLEDGTAFAFLPVEDQIYYAEADPYYGTGRVFGIGSQVDDEKYQRILDFLDWYASPEGVSYQHSGIEGFSYEVREDGKRYRINDTALRDNLPVPEEFGGGGYSDGNNQINQWIVSSISVNPETGEQYTPMLWETQKEANWTEMKDEWLERFGAPQPVDYMKKNDVLLISPNVSVSLPSDPNDIQLIRNQCGDTLNDYSWRMIYADSDEEFDSMWDEMVRQMEGLGFEELYEYDVEKHQVEIDAKKAVSMD